jgi:hypothetical protein
MLEKDYLNKLNIPFDQAKNHMFEKTLASLTKYSKEKKDALDQLNTVYHLLNYQNNEAYIILMEGVNKDKRSGVQIQYSFNLDMYKIAALQKIINHITEILHEITLTISLDNNYYPLAVLFRQVVEYLTIYDILAQDKNETSSLYLNHSVILEYHSLKQLGEINKIDHTLEKAYEFSILNFCRIHNVDEKTAVEKYREPYGFLYNTKFIEENSKSRLSFKSIRSKLFLDVYSDDFDFFNRLIETADQMIHPTGSFHYYYQNEMFNHSELNTYFLNFSMIFIKVLFSDFSKYINNKTHSSILKFSIKTIDNLSHKSISESVVFEEDFKNIFKIYKKIKSVNPTEAVDLIIDKFNEESIGVIPFIETLKYIHDNLTIDKKKAAEHLDIIYTLNDMHQSNFSHFIVPKYQKSISLMNVNRLYFLTTYQMKFINIFYNAGSIQLLQKIFRSFVEHHALIAKLINSSETINQRFLDLGYIALEDSLFIEGYDKTKNISIFNQLKKDMDMNDNGLDKYKEKKYTLWTLSKDESNKIKVRDMNDLKEEYYKKVYSDNKILNLLYKESSYTMHAGLYGNEISNDTLFNDYQFIHYIHFIDEIQVIFLDQLNKIEQIENDKNFEISNNMISEIIRLELIRIQNYFNKKYNR